MLVWRLNGNHNNWTITNEYDLTSSKLDVRRNQKWIGWINRKSKRDWKYTWKFNRRIESLINSYLDWRIVRRRKDNERLNIKRMNVRSPLYEYQSRII